MCNYHAISCTNCIHYKRQQGNFDKIVIPDLHMVLLFKNHRGYWFYWPTSFGRLLHTSLRHCQQTTSALCQSTYLTVPHHRLSTFGRQAFSVTGPTVWNSLPDSLRDPALSSDRFRQLLKTNLFRRYHEYTQRSRDASRLCAI